MQEQGSGQDVKGELGGGVEVDIGRQGSEKEDIKVRKKGRDIGKDRGR